MFIGQTRFLASSLKLETATGEQRPLTRVQAAVLVMLLGERGRVVSRASIQAAIATACGSELPQQAANAAQSPKARADSRTETRADTRTDTRADKSFVALDDIMASLERLIGADWHSHFEVVGRQGFILHHRRPARRLFARPAGELSAPLFVGLILILAGLLFFLNRQLPTLELLPFSQQQTLTNASGESLLWRRVGETNTAIKQLKAILPQCEHQPWQRISVSASSAAPHPLLHLVLEGGALSAPQNLKLFDIDGDESLSLAVLKEAGVCD
ncbi:hypothetical protein KJI95_03395 [Shewanella sp. JM162201]|uniref:OmpR/PhoB-type domain-containing protein n=1 Tax=Shewanella jiangmenensis TaxID=2837387 RepID=A0ABS5V1T8_9GAMM|nr:hypothetical protein [Shewanella jiangmenensis]MBT1443566.1 hypothetical protein [Shewanella jiangmenensis]